MITEYSRKVAIITGSGGGIGEVMAKLFSSKGIATVVADIDIDKAGKVAKEINQINGNGIAVKVDVTNRKDVEMMVENTIQTFGRLDILINNAGIHYITPIEDVPDEEWNSILAVNVRGVYNCSKFVIPPMKKNRWGRIINISSSAGKMGGRLSSIHYAASKAAVICMTKSFATHLAPYNITVNSVCPGGVNAGGFLELPKEVRQKAIDAVPLRRFADPIEIAQAVLFLSSEEASYITGESLDVNGGTVMD